MPSVWETDLHNTCILKFVRTSVDCNEYSVDKRPSPSIFVSNFLFILKHILVTKYTHLSKADYEYTYHTYTIKCNNCNTN